MQAAVAEAYRQLSLKPHWEHYMKVVFPTMMAHTPGGVEYNPNIPMDARVDQWFEQFEIIETWNQALGIRVDGYPSPNPAYEPRTPAFNAVHYSVSTRLRVARRQWKRAMEVLGWECGDHLWRNPTRDDDQAWAHEWRVFRRAAHQRYGQPKDRDFSSCCD